MILAFAGLLSISFLFGYCLYYNEYILLLTSVVVYKIVGLLANQISMHRYLGHNSFATGKLRHLFLCWISVFVGQGSPLRVVAVHRCHHKNADTITDVHSPLFQSWWRLFMLTFEDADWARSKQMIIPRDLVRDRTIMFIHNYYIQIWIVLLALSALIGWKFLVFFVLANVGWNVIHVWLFRVVLIHTKITGSYRNFDSPDYSWNNKLIVLLDIGEGLHNNHHMYPNRYDQAMKQGEFDPAGWIISKLFDVRINRSTVV